MKYKLMIFVILFGVMSLSSCEVSQSKICKPGKLYPYTTNFIDSRVGPTYNFTCVCPEGYIYERDPENENYKMTYCVDKDELIGKVNISKGDVLDQSTGEILLKSGCYRHGAHKTPDWALKPSPIFLKKSVDFNNQDIRYDIDTQCYYFNPTIEGAVSPDKLGFYEFGENYNYYGQSTSPYSKFKDGKSTETSVKVYSLEDEEDAQLFYTFMNECMATSISFDSLDPCKSFSSSKKYSIQSIGRNVIVISYRNESYVTQEGRDRIDEAYIDFIKASNTVQNVTWSTLTLQNRNASARI